MLQIYYKNMFFNKKVLKNLQNKNIYCKIKIRVKIEGDVMKRKLYKILIILFFIILLKIIYGNAVFGVELWVYDKEGDDYEINGNQLKDGATIECDIKNKELKLYIWTDKLNTSNLDVDITSDNTDIMDIGFPEVRKIGEYDKRIMTAKLKKAGEAKLTIKASTWIYTVSLTGVQSKATLSTKSITLNIKVTDLQSDLKNTQTTLDNATQYVDDLKNAYKTIPDADADASTIHTFLLSDAQNNSLKNLETVPDETIRKWIETLQKATNDIGGAMGNTYSPSLTALGIYLNDGYSDEYLKQTCISGLGGQYEITMDANQTTIDSCEAEIAEIEFKLLKIAGDAPRNEIVFANDVLEDINQYKPDDMDSKSSEKIENVTSQILTSITDIGIAAAVIILAILGIKYMIGSVEEKAEYKKDLIPYLIGALILFGITSFVKILMAFGEQIGNI